MSTRDTLNISSPIFRNRLCKIAHVPLFSRYFFQIEDKIDYDSLNSLFGHLQEAHSQGKTAITLEEFKHILKDCLSSSGAEYSREENEQIEALFKKIDSESRDKITIVSQKTLTTFF